MGGVALEMTTYTFTYCFIAVEKVKYFVCFMLQLMMIAATPLAWWMSDVPQTKIKVNIKGPQLFPPCP